MCPSLNASIRIRQHPRCPYPSFRYLSDARGERCCSKRRGAGEHGTMSKVGNDCPPVMRRRIRALLASKVRRGQGNRISPANNLKGSRAGRKVGYAPGDDQPGSNPFDLRILAIMRISPGLCPWLTRSTLREFLCSCLRPFVAHRVKSLAAQYFSRF
jgi:hypothetical protein